VRYFFIILILLFSSCRTGVRAEAGLNPKFYKSSFAQLTSNSNGFWHVVSPTKLDDSKYAVIEKDGVRKAFYVFKKGKYTAFILPISPNAYAFLDPIRDGKIDIEFTNDPETFLTSDPMGWFDAKSKTLTWLGPKIQPSKVVLFSEHFENEIRLSTWIAGGAIFDGTALAEINYTYPGDHYFVLPDSFVASNREKVVQYGEISLPELPAYNVVKVKGNVESGFTTRFYLQELALKTSAEILSYTIGDLSIIYSGTPVIRNGLEVGVTQTPLIFSNVGRIPEGIHALQLARTGNFLSSLNLFLGLDFNTTGGNYGAQLRTVELAALGGYVDWGRFVILREQQGLNADDALSIAKMHILSGEAGRAKYFVNQAIDRFENWGPDGVSGLALSYDLLARIQVLEGGESEAISSLEKSAKLFENAGDEMRAAEQESRLGQLVFPKDNIAGLKWMLLSRSRFYHGHSEFHTALVELIIADMYADAGDEDKAFEMVGYARERFVALNNPAGLNRVDVVVARIEKKKEDLRQSIERALKHGDEIGAADAAASLAILDPYSKQRSQLIVTLAIGMQQMTERAAIERAQDAMATLCEPEILGEVKQSASVFAMDAVGQKCKVKATLARKKIASLDPLIRAGYAKLASGDKTAAKEIEGKLNASLNESLRQTSPFKASQIILFQAAIANADQKDFRPLENAAIEILRKSVAPNKVAGLIRNLVRDVLKYNQLELAAELSKSGLELASEQSRKADAITFAMEHLRLRHQSKDWDQAFIALRLAEPIFTDAGEKSAGLLSTLAFYEGDLLYRTGKSSQGVKSNLLAKEKIKAAKAEEQIAIYVLAIEFALSRGQSEDAKSLLADATRVSTGQSFAKATEGYSYSAWVSVLHGNIQYLEGRDAEAYKSYANAASMLMGQKGHLALKVFIKANRGLGVSARTENEARKVVNALEKLQDDIRENEPQLLADSAIALAEIRILRGRPDEALKTLLDSGLTQNSTVESSCWWGRASVLIGKFKGAQAALKRCSTFGVFPENFEAKMLLSLLSDAEMEKKAHQVSMLSKAFDKRLSVRQKQRIRLIEGIAKKRKNNAFREEKMKVGLTRAKEKNDLEALRWAAEKYANFLIESGRPSDAIGFFEEKDIRNAFYEKDETHSAMVRLRMLAKVRGLTPILAMNYGYQVAEALDEGISFDDQAAILIYIAQNDFILGLWSHASLVIQEGFNILGEVKDRSWQRQMKALVKSFSLSIVKNDK